MAGNPTDGTAKRQSALAELSQLALQSGELEELLEESVALVTQILQVRYSEVLEYQAAENRFLLRAGLGWKPVFGLLGQNIQGTLGPFERRRCVLG